MAQRGFNASEVRLNAGTTKSGEGRVFHMTRGGEKKPKPILAFSKAWKNACIAAGCLGRIRKIRYTTSRLPDRHRDVATRRRGRALPRHEGPCLVQMVKTGATGQFDRAARAGMLRERRPLCLLRLLDRERRSGNRHRPVPLFRRTPIRRH